MNVTQYDSLNVFANTIEENEDIYPPTIVEIASEQCRDKTTERYFVSKRIEVRT